MKGQNHHILMRKHSLFIVVMFVIASFCSQAKATTQELKTKHTMDVVVEMAKKYQQLITEKSNLETKLRISISNSKQIESLLIDKNQKITRLNNDIQVEQQLLLEMAQDKTNFQASAQSIIDRNSHVDTSLVDRRLTRDKEQQRYNKANVSYFMAKDVYEKTLLSCQKYSDLSKNCMSDDRIVALRKNLLIKNDELKSSKMLLDQSQRLVDQSKRQQKAKDNTVLVYERGVEEIIQLEIKHMDHLDFLKITLIDINKQKQNLLILKKRVNGDITGISHKLNALDKSLQALNPSIANL